MSISQICIDQHEQELKTLKKVLIYYFAVSILVHIVSIIALPYFFKANKLLKADEPIEILIVDQPEEKILPTPEPSIKPEEIPLLEQPEPVNRVPVENTETRLIQPTIEPVTKTNIEPSPIKPEIPKEVPSPNREDTATEKPENLTPKEPIADSRTDSSPVISGESPSEFNSDSNEIPPNKEVASSNNNTKENSTVEKPLDEASGISGEGSGVIADKPKRMF